MTQQKYIIDRKLSIVKLSENLGNISDACRKLGVSRQHYYDIKKALEEEGIEGLLEKARNKPRISNRVAPEIEEALLSYSLEYPTHGQVRVVNELKRQGIILNPGGVRSVLDTDLGTGENNFFFSLIASSRIEYARFSIFR